MESKIELKIESKLEKYIVSLHTKPCFYLKVRGPLVSMADIEKEILASIDENMRQIKELLKLAHLPDIRETFTEEMSEAWERYLYENLDGEKSTRELASDLPVARLTAMQRLKTWRDQGMVRQGKQGRYDKVLSLESLGISVPDKGEIADGEE